MSVDVYYWVRFIGSVIGTASWGYLVLLAYPFVRRQQVFRMRLFLFVALFMLANWTGVLFLSSVVNLLNRPEALPGTLVLALNLYLTALVATSGVALSALFPRSGKKDG